MMPVDSVLTKSELLERLKASNRPISPRQLERWWKAGHVDRPIRRHVRGSRGSVSTFSPRAFDQAAAMFDLGQTGAMRTNPSDRRLLERAFQLWWSGKPIALDPRRLLRHSIEPLVAAFRRIQSEHGLRQSCDESSDSDLAFDLAERYVQEHYPDIAESKVFRPIMANLGKNKADSLSVLVTLLTTTFGGTPAFEPSYVDGEPSLASLVVRAFGGAQFGSVEANQESQLREVLEVTKLLSAPTAIDDLLAGLDDFELDTARRYAKVLLEDFPIVLEAHSLLFGQQHPLTRAMKTFAWAKSMKALAVLGIAYVMRRQPPQQIAHLISQIETSKPQAEALCILSRTFPGYRKLLLVKNAKRLAALPEETKRLMFETIRSHVR